MVGSGIILLPFLLHKMSAEAIGIWNIFQTITALVLLLDFGFRPSFARNISYIFSGVSNLQKNGIAAVEGDAQVNYALLKGTIRAMQRFYRWVALGVFALLATVGTAYFYFILQKYSGDRQDVMIAWILLIAINCYNLYTYYYDALMLGKGYVRRNQQINIIAQLVYLSIAIGLIYAGLGLSAVVAAQLTATIIRRMLFRRVFFTPELRRNLEQVEPQDTSAVLRAIYPNAVKVGLTGLGGFLVNKSAVLMGSAFLSLEQVACYGITLQVMDVLARCATVTYESLSPRIAQCRAEKDLFSLRRYYIYATGALVCTYIAGGLGWVFLGDWILTIIHSETTFVPTAMLCTMLVISLLEKNHAVSAGFIAADNRIPFFIPSLVSGAATVLLLWLFLQPLNMGIWGMILAPGIAQIAYQNWKWPSVIIRELHNA